MVAFIQNLGMWNVLIILIVALLLFGNRLPEVARSFGRSINEFKRGMRDIEDDIDDDEKRKPREKLERPPVDRAAESRERQREKESVPRDDD